MTRYAAALFTGIAGKTGQGSGQSAV